MFDFFRWLYDAITTFIEKIAVAVGRFIVNSISYLINLVGTIWEVFRESLLNLLSNLGVLLENVFVKISNFVFESFLRFLTWAIEKILPPEGVESFSATVEDMRTILAAFDVFLPIHEMFGYIGIIVAAWITCFVIRIIAMLLLRLILMF